MKSCWIEKELISRHNISLTLLSIKDNVSKGVDVRFEMNHFHYLFHFTN